MNKICTDINQSKKLIELGIDINTADMLWTYDFIVNDINGLNVISEQLKPEEKDIPAWSLSALLELMPKDESKTIDLCLGGDNGIEHTFDWFCTCDENDEPYGYKTFHTSNPIDCTFEMICWLKENNKM